MNEIFSVWFLIGAALVFWMQAGFAMVEAGFTRAKNTGNILMKNLMDFCIGTVVFIAVGFGLLLGEDVVGIIGKPGFDIFSDYAGFDWSNFVFNLVFCATTATIVSGAMAERTRPWIFWKATPLACLTTDVVFLLECMRRRSARLWKSS